MWASSVWNGVCYYASLLAVFTVGPGAMQQVEDNGQHVGYATGCALGA